MGRPATIVRCWTKYTILCTSIVYQFPVGCIETLWGDDPEFSIVLTFVAYLLKMKHLILVSRYMLSHFECLIDRSAKFEVFPAKFIA